MRIFKNEKRMFCVKKYIYYEEKMKLLLTFALLFTCFCVVRVQSVKSGKFLFHINI